MSPSSLRYFLNELHQSYWAFPKIDVAQLKTIVDSSETFHFVRNWLLYHSRLLKQKTLSQIATIGPKTTVFQKTCFRAFWTKERAWSEILKYQIALQSDLSLTSQFFHVTRLLTKLRSMSRELLSSIYLLFFSVIRTKITTTIKLLLIQR